MFWKNLFPWRYHLFFNNRVLKSIFISFLLLLVGKVFLFSSDVTTDAVYYGVITHIDASGDTPPISYIENTSGDVTVDKIIVPGSTILTSSNQQVEMIIYRDATADGIVIINENTDFRFDYNAENEILEISVVYGSIRTVIKEGAAVTVNSESIKSELYGVDMGFYSIVDGEQRKAGYVIVFGGEALLAGRSATKNFTAVKTLNIARFIEDRVENAREFLLEEYLEWKERMLIKSDAVPEYLPVALEYLNLEVVEGDVTTDVTEDIVVINEKKVDYKKILNALLSFEAGNISYENNIGITLAYTPGTTFFDEKLEFMMDFSVFMIPSKIFTDDVILKTNRTNNEWSFGSDQDGNAAAIVYDIFDDLLLKLKLFRYNTENDAVYLNIGRHYNISDFMNYSVSNFNSFIFYPGYKNTSLLFKVNLNWFEAIIFGENIMPRGLYFTELNFMTPAKSFRFRFKLSGAIDCFDLIQFDEEESYFPAQFNTTFNFDAFNVPSFGFSLFLSGGIYMPFSYNFSDSSSAFNDMTASNSLAVIANSSCTFGFKMRLREFNFSGEFVYDSGLNKIGLFDIAYMASRDNQANVISNWLADVSSRDLTINDFNFGVRAIVGYDILDMVEMEASYQITFPDYYDKLFFKLIIDITHLEQLSLSVFVLWKLERIINTLQNLKQFQENNIGYFGLIIKPLKSLEVNFSAGVYPDFITYSDPWYCKFVLNVFIRVRPFAQ